MKTPDLKHMYYVCVRLVRDTGRRSRETGVYQVLYTWTLKKIGTLEPVNVCG